MPSDIPDLTGVEGYPTLLTCRPSLQLSLLCAGMLALHVNR